MGKKQKQVRRQVEYKPGNSNDQSKVYIRRNPFDDESQKKLNLLLGDIEENLVPGLEWQYSDDEKELYLNKLGGTDGDESLTFSTFKSAKAFLEGYILGYNHGSNDLVLARESEADDLYRH